MLSGIGAHLGRYSLISAKRVGDKEGKVISIKANPLVLEKLKKILN